MDLKDKILVALGLDKEETKLGFQAKSDDGTIFVSTAEELEAGVDISVLTEDGTTIAVPAGTYKLDTGVSFRVEADGIVAEVLESETEEEETVEEMAVEEDKKEDYEEEADVGDWRGMEKRIENLEIAVAKLKESKVGGDDEVEEMAEEVPTTNPKTIKTTEVKEFSADEELENLKAENEKLKTELAESPADAPINTNKFSSERPAPTAQDFRRMNKHEKFLYNLNKY
tara:strand:+ start:539 stop:1222 length:684 start_codon:yes stop_codon:yes gene_type:complete